MLYQILLILFINQYFMKTLIAKLKKYIHMNVKPFDKYKNSK